MAPVSEEVIIYAEVAERLVAAVPSFRPVLEEHLADYEGELIQHLLFGDLSRFTLQAFVLGDTATTDQVIDFIGRAWRHGDDGVRNLVRVSFVENFIDTAEESRFVATWPTDLQRLAEEMGEYWAQIAAWERGTGPGAVRPERQPRRFPWRRRRSPSLRDWPASTPPTVPAPKPTFHCRECGFAIGDFDEQCAHCGARLED
jgi:hypothetical protein